MSLKKILVVLEVIRNVLNENPIMVLHYIYNYFMILTEADTKFCSGEDRFSEDLVFLY